MPQIVRRSGREVMRSRGRHSVTTVDAAPHIHWIPGCTALRDSGAPKRAAARRAGKVTGDTSTVRAAGVEGPS
ncbi:MAG: hypothetical protein KAI97_04625 [Gemmatimonadetes bacterium]|nr:hypothetical protein [Gemmatimonadota bacterium]